MSDLTGLFIGTGIAIAGTTIGSALVRCSTAWMQCKRAELEYLRLVHDRSHGGSTKRTMMADAPCIHSVLRSECAQCARHWHEP